MYYDYTYFVYAVQHSDSGGSEAELTAERKSRTAFGMPSRVTMDISEMSEHDLSENEIPYISRRSGRLRSVANVSSVAPRGNHNRPPFPAGKRRLSSRRRTHSSSSNPSETSVSTTANPKSRAALPTKRPRSKTSAPAAPLDSDSDSLKDVITKFPTRAFVFMMIYNVCFLPFESAFYPLPYL